MVEFVILVAVWIVAFVTGWHGREKYAERKLNRLFENVERETVEQVRKNLIHIEIEQHDGRYFVYNMKDKTFMAQGDTRQQLESVLEEKYPGKKFAATEENLVEVGFANVSNSK